MSRIKGLTIKFLIMAAMLMGLPLLGVFLAGYPVARYLEFPPQTRYVQHAPFSWTAFFIYAVAILAVILTLILLGFKSYRLLKQHRAHLCRFPFPWWGWIGVFGGAVAWVLAWTRFECLAPLQAHTFSPLWFAYILVVNGLCYRRTGRCLLTRRTSFFLLLFPFSAGFWWFFEYLNRFVQNWFYVGSDFSPRAYFWYATLPFATVLPAVLSTREWLLSYRWFEIGFGNLRPSSVSYLKLMSWMVVFLAAIGLTAIGVWPNYLFPLLWVSPLLIVLSLQTLFQEETILTEMAAGDWSRAAAAAGAALVCGWFWEMWNIFSLAKWEYGIPFVHRFQVFEMPVLGYAGYLPFGLECAVIGDLVGQLFRVSVDKIENNCSDNISS